MNAPSAITALLLLSSTVFTCAADTPAPGPASTPPQWRQLIPRASYTARDAEIAALSEKLTAENPQRFEAKIHHNPSGGSMPYRLFKPGKLTPGTKLPLLLILHGGSGRGTDNLAHLTGKHIAVTNGTWTLPRNQSHHPCIVVAPQCPPDPATWTYTDWAADTHPFKPEPAAPMQLVLEILDAVMKDPAVDLQRIYVIGSSMGGYATWDILTRRPHLFAAAIPVCGALSDGQAKNIAHIPIWIFHGGADELVPVKVSRDAFAALTTAGGHPRYTEYEGATHSMSSYTWTEPGLIDWLFQQKR